MAKISSLGIWNISRKINREKFVRNPKTNKKLFKDKKL